MVKTLSKKPAAATSVTKGAASLKTPKEGKSEITTMIKYCSDFTGLDPLGIALDELTDPIPTIGTRHLFGCDKLRASRNFVQFHSAPEMWYNDVLKRDTSQIQKGAIDLYGWTAPCQGLSSAGLQMGIDDPRSQLALVSVRFIVEKRPKAFLSEQVKTLLTFKKHKELWDLIISNLAPHYVLAHGLVNSSNYTPQHRERLYLMGVRKDCMRKNMQGVTFFPPPPMTVQPLSSLITPLPKADWEPYPPKHVNVEQHENVMNAYIDLQKKGVNPWLNPVIVDYKASPKFSSFMTDQCMTLTRTRASQFGYWCSTKGGNLNVEEMARLQGYCSRNFKYAEAGLSDSAAAGCLGNGQTYTVVRDMVPGLLFLAKLISHSQYLQMRAHIGINP